MEACMDNWLADWPAGWREMMGGWMNDDACGGVGGGSTP